MHWAYAAFFGAGRYSIGGNAETTVLGAAPGHGWREAGVDESGQRRAGLRLRVPFAVANIGWGTESGGDLDAKIFRLGIRSRRSFDAGGLRLYWHVLYTRYPDEIRLDSAGLSVDPASLGSEWELGAAFGPAEGSLSFWRFSLDRVGIVYRFDSHGDFSGIGIVFKSLFDR